MYTGLHVNLKGLYVNSPYSCQILITLESSRQIFKKFSNIKFYKNPSTFNSVASYRRTDITEMIVRFRTIINAPKNWPLTVRRVQLNIAASWHCFMKQILTNSKKYSSSPESDSHSADAEILHPLYTRRFDVTFKVSRLKIMYFVK